MSQNPQEGLETLRDALKLSKLTRYFIIILGYLWDYFGLHLSGIGFHSVH